MTTEQFERRDARSSFKKLNLFVQEEIPKIEEEINGLYESNRNKSFEINALEHIKKELEEEVAELLQGEDSRNSHTKDDLYLMFALGAIVGGFVIYLVV